MPHLKKAPTAELIKLYELGFSCAQIGKMFDMTRQAVHERLIRNKVEMRKKKKLPFIMYDGIKWTMSKSTGYYRNTDRTSRGYSLHLHRYKYEKEVKSIPNDWDVHHIDGDKYNNELENLKAISKSDHASLHWEIRKRKNENNNV